MSKPKRDLLALAEEIKKEEKRKLTIPLLQRRLGVNYETAEKVLEKLKDIT